MKQAFKYLLTLLALTALLLCTLLSASAAGSSAEKAAEFKNPAGRIMNAANKGDWHSFPENSVPAILSAADKGSDIVRLDVKKTKDDILVLFADETINRMCYPTPETPVYLADITTAELSQYTLRTKQGDSLAEPTSYYVPSLKQALASTDEILFLLDFDWSLRDEVYTVVRESGKTGSVIFLTRTSPKEAAAWKVSLPEVIMTLGYQKGNVVFLSTSYVKNYLKSGDAVWLATNNPYGMNFQNVVTSLFPGNGRALASPSMPELCGKKTDCETWWNDLVSRGYSIILTDFPEELTTYIQNTLNAQNKLSALNETANSFHLPDVQADVFTEYKRSYNKAKTTAEALLSKGFASELELKEAAYNLQRAMDDIERNITQLREGTSGLTITPTRIVIALLAVVTVFAAQIYTHKKMKKIKK